MSGIEPATTLPFKGWQIDQGSYLTSPDETAAIVGAAAAKQFRLQPGSTVRIRGEQLSVKGVLKETGGRDDFTLFLPMATAQRIYKSVDRVSYVAVKVDDLARTDGYIEKIKETVSLGVVSDKQMLKSVLSIVGTVNITFQLIAAVSVLAAAFGIINTMLTATYERKREIGILQSLGAKQSTIFSMFMLESGFYGLIGGIPRGGGRPAGLHRRHPLHHPKRLHLPGQGFRYRHHDRFKHHWWIYPLLRSRCHCCRSLSGMAGSTTNPGGGNQL